MIAEKRKLFFCFLMLALHCTHYSHTTVIQLLMLLRRCLAHRAPY